VLSNIEPPTLRRKAAIDKQVEKIVKHDSWPIQPDILNPSLLRLTSRKPLWLDLQPVDIKSRWRHNWKSAQVVNSDLVCDPTILQLGFDLPRQQWSLLNHFRTEQGHCKSPFPSAGTADTDLCPCGETQTMSQIVDPVPWQHWMAAHLGYTLPMKTLFRGWPIMVHDTHSRIWEVEEVISLEWPHISNCCFMGIVQSACIHLHCTFSLHWWSSDESWRPSQLSSWYCLS